MTKTFRSSQRYLIPAAICVIACSAFDARAQVQFVNQRRNISIATSADGTVLTASAPNFAPFSQTLENSTLFISPIGPRINRARTTITSILDTNGLQATGECEGEGGEDDSGVPETGENHVDIDVDFDITQTTPFHLSALPRPSMTGAATDSFRIRLHNLDTHEDLFDLGTSDPPTLVNLFGSLAPARYNFRFHADFTVATDFDRFAFSARLLFPPFGCDTVDFNNDGSVFDPQDIEAFLSVFAEGPCLPETALCNDIDFNNDMSNFDPQDIEAFLRVYAEGSCL